VQDFEVPTTRWRDSVKFRTGGDLRPTVGRAARPVRPV